MGGGGEVFITERPLRDRFMKMEDKYYNYKLR